jgi:hypothetical protein
MDEDVMWAIVAIVIWGPPALALSVRFALKPIVEAIARLRETIPQSAAGRTDDRRIALLEAEVAHLAGRLESMEKAEEFQRQLRAGKDFG